MSSDQLSHEIYKWLTILDVLPPNLRYKSNGNFELDTKSSDGLMSGFLIAKLIVKLAQDHGASLNQPLLASIKQSNTPAAKVYNWNILAESFMKLNVSISKETQKEITAGNFGTLLRLLLELHKKFNPKKAERKDEEAPDEINFKKLQLLQNYSEAETFLEMVIMIIGQNFSLTPKQTVSTLSDNAKYYAHMVVKGIKGSFAEVLSMIDTFAKQIPNLMYLGEKSPEKNTEFFLDLIKPTLISREADVAKKGCALFKAFLEESLKYNSKNLVYQVLCREGVGFDFLYMGLKRHPDLGLEFAAFIDPLIGTALKDFFEVHLKRTINNEQEYLKILLKMLEAMTSNPESKTRLKESGLIEVWLKSSEDSFSNKKKREENLINQETKLIYLELLCTLWKEYGGEIDQEEAEELLMKGIEELKKNVRKEIYTVKIPALLRLFDFLHYLADCKNKVAAILYKKLIFLFIENHEEEEIREIILSNFVVMLRKYPAIPIDFLLEPLLRQLGASEGRSYVLNMFDFQFLVQLCRHPRMEASFGLSYLEYFSKLYIKSFIFAKLVIRLIHILTNRFCQEDAIVEFLKKNVDATLNLYGLLTFNRKKLSKEDSIFNKQKKSLAIELIKHYIELEHHELGLFILDKVVALYSQWVDDRNYTDKGLKYLINLFGDVDQLILQQKLKQHAYPASEHRESQQTIEISNDNDLSRPTPKSESYKELAYMKEKGMGYKLSKRTSKTRMEELLERSAVKADPKVLKDIEDLKERLREEARRKGEDERKELKKVSKQNNLNSIELLQRNLSLGYAKLSPLQEDRVLFDFDSVKSKQLKMSIRFHSLQELEEQDEKSAEVVLKQYYKQIKSLFMKYSLISATSKDEGSPLMSFTEIVKMVKEKSVSSIHKVAISDMIATINYSKRKDKNVLSGIEETQFNQFLIKLTDYVIQEEKNAVEVPFGLKLELILKTLFQGEVFYENKFRFKEPANIAKLREQLNREEEVTEIPEGYKKIRETQVDLQYKINENNWGISHKYQTAYEITDWLINRSLGIHVVTPTVEIKQKYNLIQVPKPIKPKDKVKEQGKEKQQTDAKIKVQPEVIQNQFEEEGKQMKSSKKSEIVKGVHQRRSLSHRVINKTKTDPIEQSQQQKQEKAKQLKYAEKLRQNLQKLRVEKAAKQQEKSAKEEQERRRERKKEEERRKYLEEGKERLKQVKMREEEEKLSKEAEDKEERERQKAELRRKQHQFLDKQKQLIKQKFDRINERKKELQSSREKKALNLDKLAKEVINSKSQNSNDKLKMLEVKNSLQNGPLKQVARKYDKQLTELFESYWTWDKKRIDLNSLALIFKDFHLTPQLIYPKALAETYKGIGKGQNLDFEGFKECLMKCAYRSDKLSEEHPSSEEQGSLNIQIAREIVDILKMNESNYREVVKAAKNHLS